MKKLLEIKKVLADIDARLDIVNRELKKLPDGELNYETRHGVKMLVHSSCEKGKRTRTGIAKDPDLQSKLIRKKLLLKEQKSLQHNRKLIEDLIAKYMPFSLGNSIFVIDKKYNTDAAELIKQYYETNDAVSIWAAEYTPTNYRKSERRHITSRGLYVRSKSELLIAEKLYENNVKFRYEQPIVTQDLTLYPDFTIMREDGKIFYWEHEGLTNSEEYLRKQLRKAQLYASVNIVPWDNLIVTYDDDDGIINLRIVKSEIENKLLL